MERPAYDRERVATGIVHLGIGAFHRAHQAVCTDTAIARAGGDWRIEGVSLRRPDAARRLNPQNGLYTLLVREGTTTRARVIGSIARVHVAPEDPGIVRARLADPAVRICSLTISEKGYGLDPRGGGLDARHPAVAADLARPHAPTGAVGLLVEGLAARFAAEIKPFTPLSCDNLPANGAVLRRLVLEFAAHRDASLAKRIEAEVPFPSTMVDRITPASTEATYADAARLIGREDRAAVETEPFWQWVIEDRFAAGRPVWGAAGATLVGDVGPYETMKLRMINGAHTLLVCLGVVAGLDHVRDVMADPLLAALVRRHMDRAAETLEAVPGVDFAAYADRICRRFAEPAIAHATRQIAMDTTQKLPQRILTPAVEARAAGRDATTFALTVAAWMRLCLGRREDGSVFTLDDPRAEEIAAALTGRDRDAATIALALFALPGLFPEALLADHVWREQVEGHLATLLRQGVHAAARSVLAA